MTKNKLTIVIPFKDAEPYLQFNVDSVSGQLSDCDGVEAVYVDDGSQDLSAGILKRALSPDIRMIQLSRGNPYVCRNEAAFQRRSEYVAFIDADTLLSEGWLRKVMCYIRTGETDWIVGPYLTDSRKSFLLKLYNSYQTVSMKSRFAADAPKYFSAYGGNMVVRKEIFESLQGFDVKRRGSDAAFSKKYLNRYGVSRVVYDPSLFVTHLEVRSAVELFRKIQRYRRGAKEHSAEYRNTELTPKLQVTILKKWIAENVFRICLLPFLLGMLLLDQLAKRMMR